MFTRILILTDTYHWTDSVTVLCWLKNRKQWKQYVKNCVEEIQNLTDVGCWRFCPGGNPADLPSRSCRGKELVHNQLWWQGPEFLKKSPEVWPDIPTKYDSADAHKEQVRNPPEIIHSLPILNPAISSIDLAAVIHIERYSSKLKLLRVTALVHRRRNRSGWSGFGRTTFRVNFFHFYKKQVVNRSASAIFRLVRLIILFYNR